MGPGGTGPYLPCFIMPPFFFYPLLLNISNLHVLHLFVFLLFVTGLCSGQSYSCRTATSLTWHLYLTCTYFISPLLYISFSSLIYPFVLSLIQFFLFLSYLCYFFLSRLLTLFYRVFMTSFELSLSCVFVLICVLFCFIALRISVNKPF